MKYLACICLVFFVYLSFGQNATTTINITPGENSLSTTLPFDKIIYLKWNSKEPIRLEYAGLETVNKGAADAYREYAQTKKFYADYSGQDSESLKYAEKKLSYELSPPSADGKYDLMITIPPISPNKFYDVKILRRPMDFEAGLYFDLFSNQNTGSPEYRIALEQINITKRTFLHTSADIPKLQAFYNVFLKEYYDKLKKESEKPTPSATLLAEYKAKIKQLIMYLKPPDPGKQTGAFITLFKAFEKNDTAGTTAAIKAINALQSGFVQQATDDKHIGAMDVQALKSIYGSDIKYTYSKYAAAEVEKDAAKDKIAELSTLINNLLNRDSPLSDEEKDRFNDYRLSLDPYTSNESEYNKLIKILEDKKLTSDKSQFDNYRQALNSYETNTSSMTVLKTKILSVLAEKRLLADDFLIFGQILSSTSVPLTFDSRTTFSITPDFGYVNYGFQKNFNGIAPYLGFQIEFRYFDKNIPFNMIRPKTIWHYLSFTSGLTLSSLKKEGKREDFFSGKSLLAGFGIRMTSATRVTLGGILFNREDPNPLIDNKKLSITPFLGLSIDLRLKSILADWYGLNPTKKP